ncbi:ROK family protein [Novosphingobium sp. fls2-241-R2A-195]|uniref:ROK family protein n=1 Tax=Novosphingobium sp. fls2-241-R2A-195 TaxID=3040296 RepID=UPI00254E877C|nr:ROK family protein [Novosphingobium sp. fls2-241-R2A-195]
MTIFGAIEAGGTKFVCAVGSSGGGSLRTVTIPTRDPDATFADVEAFFRSAVDLGPLAGLGIASFGPVGVDPAGPQYGRILATPKPGWEGSDMIARALGFLDVPIGLDTDVNAAALAEIAAIGGGLRDLAYVTVGTGIGVGLVSAGRTVHGIGHPEAGHIPVRRHPAHGDFAGLCPFHGDCLEGLAAGPAVAAAWDLTPSHVPHDHPFWDVEASYLAQLCASLFLTTGPQRIVLGGGVMKQERLLPLIRARTLELLGGYVHALRTIDDMERAIVSPACREPSGLVGAFLLAEDAAA